MILLDIKLKQKLRYLFNLITFKINFSKREPIVIASMGRAGSTFFFEVIRDALAKERFPNLPIKIGRVLCNGSFWFPGYRLFNGLVHKTHSNADRFPENTSARIIYVFCKPSDSILSVINMKSKKGLKWVYGHFHNLGVKGEYKNIIFDDVLMIRDNIFKWREKEGVNILLVRYEKIWQFQGEIEKFLNLKIKLPPMRKRNKLCKEAEELKEICKKNYELLDSVIDSMPDLIIKEA